MSPKCLSSRANTPGHSLLILVKILVFKKNLLTHECQQLCLLLRRKNLSFNLFSKPSSSRVVIPDTIFENPDVQIIDSNLENKKFVQSLKVFLSTKKELKVKSNHLK